MKIFHKGKLVSPYEKGRKIEGRAKINRRLIAQYKFDNTLYDLIPEFNDGFTYEYKDILDGEVTIRTIYSDSLPTTVRFGARTTSNMTLSLLEVDYLNTSNVTDMSYMFYNCGSLTSLDVNNFNTSNVTDMQYMFCNCKKLTTLDVSNFDTSNVIDMGHMFAHCKSLTSLEVSNWDTGNVTNMVNMFDLCSSLVSLDVSNWNVSKVQNMGAMFGTCSSLKELNLSNWKTDSLTKADWMFNKCLKLQELDLSSWNVNNVTNMVYMLSDCESLIQLNLSNWNLINANIADIFSAYSYSGCPNLNNIIMNNSDYNSINKIINQLPTRTTDSMGVLDVFDIDDISQIDMTTVNSKYWTIVSHTILNNARLGQTKLN